MDINLFSFDDWERENKKVVSEAIAAGLNYDPYPRTEEHYRYAEEMFRQFPADENIAVQTAYLLKNMISAQRFEFGNKRTARNMIEEFVDVNGYRITAKYEEWNRVTKKLQRKTPKAYVIYRPQLSIPSKFKSYIRGTGGGYAVKLANIPMVSDSQGSSWYNSWIIDWVKKHLVKISNQRVL